MDGNLLKLLLPLSKFSLFATLNLFTITGYTFFFFFFLERFVVAYFSHRYDKRCTQTGVYGVRSKRN